MQTPAYHSGLWFSPRSLELLADAGAWTRGLMLYRSQKVLSLEIEPLHAHWLLLGEVQGSQRQPYEVSIELSLGPNGQVVNWDSACECPVGSQCKHGVALLLQAAYQGLALLGDAGHGALAKAATPPTPEQVEATRRAALVRAEERARQEAEAQLLRWLQELDRAGGVAGMADDCGHGAAARKQPEQYLYLLSVAGSHGPAPELQMEAVLSYPKVGGGWAKPKPLRTPPGKGQTVYDLASPLDREVLQLIRAMPHGASYYYAYSFKPKVVPNGQVGLLALQQAAGTGRLFLDDGKGNPGASLQWGPPQPLRWEWHEVSSAQTTEPGWALRAKLAHSNAKLCLNSPPLYLDAALGLCGAVQAEGIPAAQLEVLLKAPTLQPSALQKHQLGLMQRLGQLPLPPVLQSLTTLTGIKPSACLQLSLTPPEDAPQRGLIQAQLRFDYGGHRGWWAGQGTSVLINNTEGRWLLQRDPEAELGAITRLYELGLLSASQGLFGIPGGQSQQDWLHWADNGFSVLRDAGFEVTLDETLRNWITHADSLEVRLQSAGDEHDDGATSPWFDLSLGLEINGQRHNILPLLPELIAAAAASPLDPQSGLPDIPPFVYLRSPHSAGFIRLPTETLKPWMAALLELVGDRDHDFSGDSLKLSRLDALRTGAALGEGALWEGAQALRAMVQQLSGHAELPEVAVPTSVQASLRPYQRQGLNWLQFLRQHSLGGILADDMGLGKTLQTLVHIQVEKDAGRLTHPALVIAPVSLMGNWQRETERFCPQLRCLVLHGKDRHAVADSMGEFDVVIAPYSLLQRDRARWLQAKWHLVVLDEAQNIKNASTHAAQVASLLQTRHRLCLSGTPMENHLGEIWSLFHFLMPGFLGSQTRFKELFRAPIEKQGSRN